jgi:hypothetical protein
MVKYTLGMPYYIHRSDSKGKKLKVIHKGKTIVHFGADGYSDYTRHKDDRRKASYLRRHETNENWGKSGIDTAGFWARWILWNKPSLSASIKDTARRFHVDIVNKT